MDEVISTYSNGCLGPRIDATRSRQGGCIVNWQREISELEYVFELSAMSAVGEFELTIARSGHRLLILDEYTRDYSILSARTSKFMLLVQNCL